MSLLQHFMSDLLQNYEVNTEIRVVVDNAKMLTKYQPKPISPVPNIKSASDHSCRRWACTESSSDSSTVVGVTVAQQNNSEGTATTIRSLQRRPAIIITNNNDIPACPTRKLSTSPGEVTSSNPYKKKPKYQEQVLPVVRSGGSTPPSHNPKIPILVTRKQTSNMKSSSISSKAPRAKLSIRALSQQSSKSKRVIESTLNKLKESTMLPLVDILRNPVRSLSKTTLGVLDAPEQAPTIPKRRPSAQPDYLSPPDLAKPSVGRGSYHHQPSSFDQSSLSTESTSSIWSSSGSESYGDIVVAPPPESSPPCPMVKKSRHPIIIHRPKKIHARRTAYRPKRTDIDAKELNNYYQIFKLASGMPLNESWTGRQEPRNNFSKP